MRAAPLGAALLLLVLAGCDLDDVERNGDAVARAMPDWSAESSGQPALPRSGARPAAGRGLGSGKPVTFAFGGDVNFEANPGAVLLEDPAALFAGVAASLEADVTMVNLETSVSERGEPAPKTYTFRAHPSAFPALRSAGVDVVSLANNHGLDYGEDALLDTLDFAAHPDTGVPIVGAGRDDAEAYEPFRVTVRGQDISILGATIVLDDHLTEAWTAGPDHPGLAVADDPTQLLEAVRTERAQADTVVVYLHWGQERNECPIENQLVLADQLVAAGADVIVGGHAHVPVGAGMLNGSYVSYGLGNFIFGSASGLTSESGVLRLTVTGRRIDAAEWVPARISGGIPTTLEGEEAAAARSSWEALRDCTNLTAGTERGAEVVDA
ncbi:MAG TPA: CapA family protein [Acidimicrobiales bacterium]|nr:CapA family protein [Acidimicrobiales bacterium]